MLYYIPLESYKERYTMQWSAAKTGWLERNWLKHKIEYTRIDGITKPLTISKGGIAVDICSRFKHCSLQIQKLLKLAKAGKITDKDTIYFDDFWHPGIEALPYAFQLLKIKPKMYAFLHAQSVDCFDFTYPMRGWMRHFEKGIGEALTGIFVNCQVLKDLVVDGNIAPENKIHVIGHIFDSSEVRERMGEIEYGKNRKNQIVFSSRWDDEKNPLFFLEVVELFLKSFGISSNTKFIICTSAKKLKSNNVQNINAVKIMLDKYPGRLEVRENLSKEEYYKILAESRIQINTASQDFISIALLEASVAGCYPIYPHYRSFPEVFNDDDDYMYKHMDAYSAAHKIAQVISSEGLFTKTAIKNREWIHKRYDVSWHRMLIVMGII